ncbi:MAG: hypothetical protein ACK4YP_02525 [Myxococcota bacterium]
MFLLLLAGCLRFQLPLDDSGGLPAEDTAPEVPKRVPRVVWGDLHNHTNLSHDGCEAPDNGCLPDSDLPAEDTFPRAAAYGLGFAAITDHAEFVRYVRPADGVDIDIWQRMRELVEAAEGTQAFGVMGYEWTSSCTDAGDDYAATHRTVLIEEPSGCAEWRIPSCHANGTLTMGAERYTYSSLEPAVLPSDLLARLNEVPTLDGCAPSRWVAFFHHVAQERPAWVDWASAESWVEGDTVVEIASEHGSSECDTRVATEGCDWRLASDYHQDDGSIQYMLQQGHKLGFVGGTDNHMDEPGRIAGGPGKVRDLRNPEGDPPWHEQFANGTVTGALTYEAAFDRADLFDAIAARNTVAASWPAGNLVIHGDGADGRRYLPGDDVPLAAMPLALTVTIDDPTITEWFAEVVDPYGQIADATTLDVPAGEARYVRIRAWAGEIEHRVFASPFFAGAD